MYRRVSSLFNNIIKHYPVINPLDTFTQIRLLKNKTIIVNILFLYNSHRPSDKIKICSRFECLIVKPF